MSGHNYLSWDIKKIAGTDGKGEIPPAEIDALYGQGYVATRLGKGIFSQTRSLRIDLKKFELSSENRRVLRKFETEGMRLESRDLPYADYDWHIGKMARDFYHAFGQNTSGKNVFSANKMKEILTDAASSNFNQLLRFAIQSEILGYAVCLKTDRLIHYAYPFYDRSRPFPNLGIGMMTEAILHAQKLGLSYFHLGSYQRPTDTYKLQFNALEWFDGTSWQTDIKKLKDSLR